MKNDSRRFKALSTLILFAIGVFFSAGLVGAFIHSGSSLERISKEGEITISARYLTHESDLNDETTFRINLSTDTGDVSKYDLKKLSFMSVDGGPLAQASNWASTGDNRHIQGILRFTGHQLHDSRQVQLIVKGINNSDDRVFEWKATDD